MRSSGKIVLLLALLHNSSVWCFNLACPVNQAQFKFDRRCLCMQRVRTDRAHRPVLKNSANSDDAESYVTVLPGLKQVLFIEVGFGADQHGQVLAAFMSARSVDDTLSNMSRILRRLP